MNAEQPLIDMKKLYSIVGMSGDFDKAEIIHLKKDNGLDTIEIVTDYVDDLDMRKLKRNLKASGVVVIGFFIKPYVPKTSVQNYHKIAIKLWVDKV